MGQSMRSATELFRMILYLLELALFVTGFWAVCQLYGGHDATPNPKKANQASVYCLEYRQPGAPPPDFGNLYYRPSSGRA